MTAPSALRAGVARSVITPPVGTPMMGFAGRGVATGIHDDLTATAIVFQDGSGESLVLIACDLIGVRDVSPICAAVSRVTGIAGSRVVVAASHTHYGPALPGGADSTTASVGSGGSSLINDYAADLPQQLAGTVAAAWRRLVPCALRAGRGTVRIGVNRRERRQDGSIVLGQNPAGPCDTGVTVVRVDSTEGRPLAVIVNCACHPVSLGGKCTELSADYPGVMRGLVEEEAGAPCLFVQGAAGDINPVVMGWDWTHPQQLGGLLGAEVLHTYRSISAPAGPPGGSLAVERSTLALPPLLPTSVSAAKALESTLCDEVRRLQAEADGAGKTLWAARRLRRVRQGLAALEGGPPVPPVEADLVAARLDSEIAIVTAPGEIFTEIGQSVVARSPYPHTIYAGYTNGSVGYVPTRAAYQEGGYEVTHACEVGPEAGELIAEESVRLLASTFTD